MSAPNRVLLRGDISQLTPSRDMDLLLRLPKHHEQKFWQSAAAIRYFVVMDTIGLLLGVLSHYVAMRQCKRPVPLAVLALAAVLQICQLTWLWSARKSYMRRRQTLQIIQRARWLLVVLCLNVYISGIERIIVHNASTKPGGLRAFVASALLSPIYNLASSLNHSLPYRLQVPFVLAVPLIEALGGFQQQQRIMKLAGMDATIKQACIAAHQLMLTPMTLDEMHSINLCRHKPDVFVIVLCMLLVGAVLPLVLAYTFERAAKVNFLLSSRAGQGVDASPAAPAPAPASTAAAAAPVAVPTSPALPALPASMATTETADAEAIVEGNAIMGGQMHGVRAPGPVGLRELCIFTALAGCIASLSTMWM